MSAYPEFPITITRHEDGDAWTFETAGELEGAIELVDSDDPAQRASVTAAGGRLVRLRVQNGHVITFELAEGWRDGEGGWLARSWPSTRVSRRLHPPGSDLPRHSTMVSLR